MTRTQMLLLMATLWIALSACSRSAELLVELSSDGGQDHDTHSEAQQDTDVVGQRDGGMDGGMLDGGDGGVDHAEDSGSDDIADISNEDEQTSMLPCGGELCLIDVAIPDMLWRIEGILDEGQPVTMLEADLCGSGAPVGSGAQRSYKAALINSGLWDVRVHTSFAFHDDRYAGQILVAERHEDANMVPGSPPDNCIFYEAVANFTSDWSLRVPAGARYDILVTDTGLGEVTTSGFDLLLLTPPRRIPECGDGHLDAWAGESCDDGNTQVGDGCAADCSFEALDVSWPGTMFERTIALSQARPQWLLPELGCVSGQRQGPQEVLTLNNTSSSQMELRVHVAGVSEEMIGSTIWWYDAPPQTDSPLEGCQQGFTLDATETIMDDRPVPAGASRYLVLSGDNAGEVEVHIEVLEPPRCGDGDIDPQLGESCDDGNGIRGDGCDAACRLEPVEVSIPGTAPVRRISLEPGAPTWIGPNADCLPAGERPQAFQAVPLIHTGVARVEIRPWVEEQGVAVVYYSAAPEREDAAQGCRTWIDRGGSFVMDAGDAGYLVFSSVTIAHELEFTLQVEPEPMCGDGTRDQVIGEACDDGGRQPGDGCDPLCQLEAEHPFDVSNPGEIVMFGSELTDDDPFWTVPREDCIASDEWWAAYETFALVNRSDHPVEIDLEVHHGPTFYGLFFYEEERFSPLNSASGCLAGMIDWRGMTLLQRMVVPAGEVRRMAFTGPAGPYEVVLRVWSSP